jgi:hypothetical protein
MTMESDAYTEYVSWLRSNGDTGRIAKAKARLLADASGVNPAHGRRTVVDRFGLEHDMPDDGIFGLFERDVRAVLAEAGDLLLRKHHDYGSRNISQSPGGPLNGLRVRMWDKTARINNLIDSDVEPSNESLRDSFIDLLNYSAIALLVLDGKWPE